MRAGSLAVLVAGLAVVARTAALAVCLAPLAASAAAVTLGEGVLRPWRDLSCALPFALLTGACPPLYRPSFGENGIGLPGLVVAATLATVAGLAYSKPRLRAAWALAGANFAYMVLMVVVFAFGNALESRQSTMASWTENWDWFFYIMLLAPASTYIARLVASRPRKRPGEFAEAGAEPTRHMPPDT